MYLFYQLLLLPKGLFSGLFFFLLDFFGFYVDACELHFLLHTLPTSAE